MQAGRHTMKIFQCARLLKLLLFTSLLFGQVQLASAELLLTAPPREKADAGMKLYGPLAKRLTRILNEKVTYVHPANWLAYQRDMRNDKYDIIFDGPHFIAWRTKNRKHKPILKLPGTLEFIIVGHAGNNKINKLSDLYGKKVCGIPPPNLGTLTVIAAFPHPARQPWIIPVRGGFKKVYRFFAKGKCEAAVFRTTFYNKKLSSEQRKTTKVLYKSRPLPNQGISVSKRVKPSARRKIIKALTQGDRIPATRNILARFGGKAKSFKAVSPGDYNGYHKLLEGVIFGW